MKKHLSKSEIKELNQKLVSYDYNFSKKDNVEQYDNLILLNGKAMFFFYENKIIPCLKLLLEKQILLKVVIDMPAVPFIVKGADIMRPGITEFDNFNKNDIIVIVDENNKKPLAVGIALFSSEESNKMDKGKIIKSIHHIGDALWSFSNS